MSDLRLVFFHITEIKFTMNLDSFHLNLFNQICKSSTDKSENIFVSPLSISLALSMLLLGADGATKQQLEDVLGVVKDEELVGNLKNLNSLLNTKENGVVIKLANSIFPAKTIKLMKSYLAEMKEAFNCKVQCLDYEANAVKSKDFINAWVEDSTGKKIKNLIADLDPDTVCVLVSCIYFKGDWSVKFDSCDTYKRDFTCTGNKTTTVNMMSRESWYQYTHDFNNKFQCVKIPYKQKEFSMMIVLPHDKDDLDAVAKCVSENAIEDLEKSNRFRSTKLMLQIPKFKIEFGLNLTNYLQTIGIEHAFEKSANFSKMTDKNNVCVSEVCHKAFIEVNEEGTEAAAATYGRIIKFSMDDSDEEEPLIQFIVDHPFLFMVKHKNQTLFMGRVNSLPDC